MPSKKVKVWNQFEPVQRKNKAGALVLKYRCKNCRNTYRNHVTELTKHLQRCLNRSPEGDDASTDLEPSSQSLDELSTRTLNTFSSPSSSQSALASNSTRRFQPSIEYMMYRRMGPKEKEDVDSKLLNLIVKRYLPFSVCETKEFKDFCYSLNRGYPVPCRKSLSGPLLVNEFKKHSTKINELLSEAKFICLIFDGWQTVTQKKVVNIVACIRKPILLRSVDVTVKLSATDDNRLTAMKYRRIIEDTMDRFFIRNKVIQICSDGEAACRKASKDAVDQLNLVIPGVESSYCKSHCMNLLVKDLIGMRTFAAKCNFIVKLLNKLKYSSPAREIAVRRAKTCLRENMPAVVLPSMTRWSYWSETLKYAFKIREILTQMSQHGEFTKLFGKNELNSEDSTLMMDMGFDGSFWNKIESVSPSPELDDPFNNFSFPQLIDLIDPIITCLDVAQSDASFKSDMYGILMSLQAQLDSDSTIEAFDTEEEAKTFISKAKDRIKSVIQFSDHLCYCLDPRNDLREHFTPTSRRDFDNEFLQYLTYWLLIDDMDEKTVYLNQFEEFMNRKGAFGEALRFSNYSPKNDPIVYWNYFSDMAISTVALRLFHMVNSSASVERCFSKQKRIHSHVRNSLKHDRVNMCTQLAFNNLEDSEARMEHRKSTGRKEKEKTSLPESDEPLFDATVLADLEVQQFAHMYQDESELDVVRLESQEGDSDTEIDAEEVDILPDDCVVHESDNDDSDDLLVDEILNRMTNDSD